MLNDNSESKGEAHLAPTHKIYILAHRGASSEAPENTMPAIELAIEKYHVDFVEMDLRVTRDGVPVALHDETLERTTDGKGLVSQYSFEELRGFDAGYRFDPQGKRAFPFQAKGVRIPALEEVLTRFPETGFCLEVKERRRGALVKIVEVIQRIPRKGRILIGAFHTPSIQYLRKALPPSVKTLLAEGEIVFAYVAFLLGLRKISLPAPYASLPRAKYGIPLDKPSWIKFLHAQGVKLFFWTVNDVEEMKELLRHGADGIVTDDPSGIVPRGA